MSAGRTACTAAKVSNLEFKLSGRLNSEVLTALCASIKHPDFNIASLTLSLVKSIRRVKIGTTQMKSRNRPPSQIIVSKEYTHSTITMLQRSAAYTK